MGSKIGILKYLREERGNSTNDINHLRHSCRRVCPSAMSDVFYMPVNNPRISVDEFVELAEYFGEPIWPEKLPGKAMKHGDKRQRTPNGEMMMETATGLIRKFISRCDPSLDRSFPFKCWANTAYEIPTCPFAHRWGGESKNFKFSRIKSDALLTFLAPYYSDSTVHGPFLGI